VNAGACFRYEDGWAVYRIVNGQARLTNVDIGHRSGLEVEILSGLNEGEQVVAYPGDQIFDATRVTPRVRRR
jgi:HlyD family secretion protein